MKFIKSTIFLIIFFFFIQCKSSSNDEVKENKFSVVDVESAEDGSYSDGQYCAEVEYSNPETGTNSTYTLVVEIENDKLTVIHWPNGGWLDSTHFIPPDILEGQASFTSDAGILYNITILDSESNCN